MSTVLPPHARAVIIGGGIAGCSVAYHLAKLGWDGIVLLEQAVLGGGTTWHAAGMVGQLRTTNSMTKINKYSVDLYPALEAETGIATGWNQVGSLIVARSEERMIQLRRTAAMAELFGVEAHLISAEESGERWPLMRHDDLLGGVWLPCDGKVKPRETALALAEGARLRGAAIVEGVRVMDIVHAKGRATGVKTEQGVIEAEVVILCGGMWARELALRCGVNLPLYPVEHHYIVSEPIAGVDDNRPCGRDPDAMIYYRSEGNSIMLGAFQERSTPWMLDRVPDDFSLALLEPDWPKFAEPLAAGRWRIPALEHAHFPRFVNGPESFTPDNNFLLGETPELRGLFVCAGFNSVGIASAGGAGKYLAEWIDGGEQSIDLWSVDVRRFLPLHNNRSFLRERVAEVLGLHYQMAWPNREFETGRNLRRSAIHERLAGRGACFGQKLGWERPLWFALRGVRPELEYSFRRQNWFEEAGGECEAARQRAAIFDQTSFSKFLLKGPDALPVLQRLCGKDVDVPAGRVVYTGLFNERGTFESDLTVVRSAEDQFYIISSSGQAVRDSDWISRHIPTESRAALADVTGAYGVLGVMGPQSRALLQRVSEADLSNAAFPFGTARWIDIGPHPVYALRVTYVGELGWELHAPMESMAAVYDILQEAGRPYGLADAGHYAINTLRLEKAYRAWGAELSTDDTPLEAGLAFAISWDKPGGFLGRDALVRLRGRPLTKRLVAFVLDDAQPLLWGGEPILCDGRPCGYTTSGAYGYTLGASVALGYVKHPEGVTDEFLRSARFELVINGQRHSASPHLRAPYDPERAKILA